MKGDKGILHPPLHPLVNPRASGTNNLLSEFAGTLVGFDDYVSTLPALPFLLFSLFSFSG